MLLEVHLFGDVFLKVSFKGVDFTVKMSEANSSEKF